MMTIGTSLAVCGCAALLIFSGVAQASYFEGMEAYRQNDFQTAMREFKALEEDPKALYLIGIMYEKGQGVTADFTEAAKWYKASADKGNSSAQYRLGRLYERGLGVDESREEAVKWYKKASRLGQSDAKQALKRLGEK